MNKVRKEFFLNKTDLVAKELLGKIIVKKFNDEYLSGEIVETEAYLPEGDIANHSAQSHTKRNAPMREEGGIMYVYKIYGIHHCINIVTEEKGMGSAVLIRALKPLWGIDIMKKIRQKDDVKLLCKGPGNLAKAMNFSIDDNYKPVYDNEEIFILDNNAKYDIIEDYRVGISKSKELPLRYYIKNCNFVSGKTKKKLGIENAY